VLFVIKVFGWAVAHTPEFILRPIAVVLGEFIFFCLRKRRRLVLSNLHHAFPEKSAAWHGRIGRESCRRMIETGLLSLATPYLSPVRLRQIIAPLPELLACHAEHRVSPRPTLICSPHLAYWEAQTAMPLIVPGSFPEFGIIYRPLDNPAADAFVKRSREQFGMKLLSRKEGFAEALKILRRKGFVGVLFDQNAGLQGALTLLLDRVCSSTELPGLMAEKFDALVYGIFPRRRAFWRIDIGVERINTAGGTGAEVTLALNRWLESWLRQDDNACASWLWAHDRWRNQDIPAVRLRLEAKRNLLAADLAARGLTDAPRRTRIWIRLPNWLGDVVMVVPLLRALRVSRPDAELTVVARTHFLPLLAEWKVADRLHALPPRGLGYWRHFWRLRSEFPDVWLLFTNSFRGDLEARLTGTRQRFGILRPGKRRPLISHAYRLPPDFKEPEHHQLELWETFLRHFGLNAPIDRTPITQSPAVRPLSSAVCPPSSAIGLIPGSENSPEKRWPVSHWRAVIESMPDRHFVIFGTANDLPIANAVAAGFDAARVENLAGKTDLVGFGAGLRDCGLLVTNDTGGMHLANILGVPLIALFGPTNPIRTGPVFSAPIQILQPPGCRPTGGASLTNVMAETVIAALRNATPALSQPSSSV
jgi:heptosyltransferase II